MQVTGDIWTAKRKSVNTGGKERNIKQCNNTKTKNPDSRSFQKKERHLWLVIKLCLVSQVINLIQAEIAKQVLSGVGKNYYSPVIHTTRWSREEGTQIPQGNNISDEFISSSNHLSRPQCSQRNFMAPIYTYFTLFLLFLTKPLTQRQ